MAVASRPGLADRGAGLGPVSGYPVVSWKARALASVGSAGRVTRRAMRYRHTVRDAWTSPGGASRLVPSPVFVLSPARSGSTLFRVILNSHSQICAPHEMHLRYVRVRVEDKDYAREAIRRLGLDEPGLEHLLWDRLMHRELTRKGKRIFVDKTPGNGAQWARLHQAWPEARFIFLIRHPAVILDSLVRARPDLGTLRHQRMVLAYAEQIQQARRSVPGPTVRYEELTADPERVTRDICRFLGTSWEPGMLQYGNHNHGSYRAGLGDWSANIKSGLIQPARANPHPDDVPAALHEICAAWGYR